MGERSDQQRCKGCVHFDVNPYVNPYDDLKGECRRYAPRVVVPANDYDTAVVWPVVRDTDFCGEFNPRKTAGARQHG